MQLVKMSEIVEVEESLKKLRELADKVKAQI